MSAATQVEFMNYPLASRRARKDHVCEPCGHTIRKGHIYYWWTWFGDIPMHMKAHQICASVKVDGEYLGLDTDGCYGVSLGEDQWDGLAEEFGPFPFDPWDAQGDQITEVMSWFSVSS